MVDSPSKTSSGGSKRRGSGLAARRAQSLVTNLEAAFASLALLDSDRNQTFPGSVLIMLGASLSKPREVIEIVLPKVGDPFTDGMIKDTVQQCNGFASVCVQATRQLMPLTSQMPAPATGKVKMWLAFSQPISPLPAANFEAMAELRCSLKRCLASVVHVTMGPSDSAAPATQAPSWLLQHADRQGIADGQIQCNDITSTTPVLHVCSTVVSGLTCGVLQ